jgi:peptide/nickel transport system substrate-binding protein
MDETSAPQQRPRRRQSIRPVAAALCCVLLLAAACSHDAAPEGTASTAATVPTNVTERDAGAPQSGGELVMAIEREPAGLSPQSDQWTSQGAFYIANAIFDPLMAIDQDGDTKPYLAESVVPNGDFTVWTITLRPGVAFQNGQPFDAAALKANLDATKKSLLAAMLGPLQSTEVTGDLSAVVHMSTPWSQFPYYIAGQAGYMVAPAMLADPDATNHPIGTGPFAFKDWTRDSQLNVTRNPNYWQKGLPYLDAVSFRVIQDPSNRFASLSSGQADAAVFIAPAQIKTAADAVAAGKLQLYSNASLESNEDAMLLNTRKPPFDDPIARQAVATAIDHQAMEDTAGRPATVLPFQPGSPYYLTPDEAGWPAPDVNRAKDLAVQYQTSHGQPLSFTLIVPNDSDSQQEGQIIQSQLAAAGITAQLSALEPNASIGKLLNKDFDAAVSGFLSAPTLDQSHIFFEQPPTGGLTNFTGISDPQLLAALDAARASGDKSVWIEQYKAVQKRMAADLDHVFTFRFVDGLAYSNDVHGVTKGTFPGTTTTAYAGTVAVPIGVATWKRQ